mmetsp:Transcript_41990/g.42852  ORF Transcript_41990/g.42852 Transcript_41990/m.42852 type:complete len:206 (+) Transcript_41990:331-948(+)
MAKRYYELHGNSKKILSAMATGVVDPHDPEGRTISFDREPYLSYDNKKKFSIANTYLNKEITRRWKQNPAGNKEPRPSGWSKPKTIEWLMDNLIVFSEDIEFIVSEEKLFCITITGENMEKLNKISSFGGCIYNSDSILRLIHVEKNDTILIALAEKCAADDRAKLDGRKSTYCPLLIEEMILKIMLDPNFKPMSRVNPELHSDF